jgi:hypothetical protein
MNSQTRPERLFRYFPPDASDFFSAKKLWFSALKDYNDPFDALPRFDILLESQRQRGIRMEHAFLPPEVNCDWLTYKKEMDRASSGFYAQGNKALPDKYRDLVNEKLRLVCFSEQLDEPLMWAHYARGHGGFVVEFDPKHSLFASDEFGKVNYARADEADERFAIEDEDQSNDDLWKILFRKSRNWVYEAEWRFVKSTNALQEGKRRDGKLMRYLEFPSDAVLRLYLGWQIPERNHNELIESLKSTEWKNVNGKKFIMRPDIARYAIKPVPWEEWLNRPREYEKELDKLISRLS